MFVFHQPLLHLHMHSTELKGTHTQTNHILADLRYLADEVRLKVRYKVEAANMIIVKSSF